MSESPLWPPSSPAPPAQHSFVAFGLEGGLELLDVAGELVELAVKEQAPERCTVDPVDPLLRGRRARRRGTW